MSKYNRLLSNLYYNIECFFSISLKIILERRGVLRGILDFELSSTNWTLFSHIYKIISNVLFDIYQNHSWEWEIFHRKKINFELFWANFIFFLSNLHYNIWRFCSIFLKIIHGNRGRLTEILDSILSFLREFNIFLSDLPYKANVFLRYFSESSKWVRRALTTNFWFWAFLNKINYFL